MAGCYSGFMRRRHPIRSIMPDIWIVSDKRNDARLANALAQAPRGSGLIFRHYHLEGRARKARFRHLAGLARSRDHLVVLAGPAKLARRWGADGAYGPPSMVQGGPDVLRLATAHNLREVGMAHRARADAVLLSPVFATRSHPGARMLGPVLFRLLAKHAKVPAIALGGMNWHRARTLRWKKWAAIDGV